MMGRTIYLADDADPRLLEFFRSLGHDIRRVRTEGVVAPPLSCHPDMFMCRLGYADDAPLISCLDAEDKGLSPEYPRDIAYNAACTGRYFIHNLKHTAPALLRAAESAGMTMVDVRQGYSKCSTVIVDENSIITYDLGLAKACEAAGLDVLTVSPGHVALPGYDTGFIGGASGRVGDTVYFNGDLEAHPDFDRIREFIHQRGLGLAWFSEWPLTDIGSII